MPDSADSLYAALPAEAHQRINGVCRQIEQAWEEGASPRLEDYLVDVQGDERKCLMRRLLQIELHHLRDALPPPDEYHARFPGDRDSIDSVFKWLERGGDKSGELPCADNDEGDTEPRQPKTASERDTVDDLSVTVSFSPSSTAGDDLLDQQTTQRPRRRRKAPLPDAIGGYKIVDYIGAGGFGEVYKALDPILKTHVAIKIPREGAFESEQDEERFIREARSAADLHHPNIVHVKAVGDEQGMPFIVCEYIPGESLSNYVPSNQPDAKESAGIAAQVADALHHAHEHNVIHRDVKPSNILIDDEGRPHLADFGLAHHDANTTSLTESGQILGTLRYISPEQASGETQRVDRRSDIYSLGIVLYQMLTGSVPFQGSAVHVHHQILYEAPTPPRQVNRNIPRDLETICLKCLAKHPKGRYATAQELADDLRRYLRNEPVQARRSTPAGRLARWCGRNKVLVSLLSAVLVLAGVLSFVTASWINAENERKELLAQFQKDVNRLQAKQPANVLDMPLEDLIGAEGAEVKVQDLLAEETDEIPVLIERLRHEDAEIRALAAEGLGSFGDKATKDAVTALQEATRDSDRRVSEAAIKALEDIRFDGATASTDE